MKQPNRKCPAPEPEFVGKDQLSEALYLKMVDDAADGLFIIGVHGMIQYASRFTERLLGYSKGGLTGKHVRRIFDLPRKGGLPQDLTKLRKSILRRLSCVANRKDGKAVVVDLRFRRLDEHRLLGLARDISREAAVAGVELQQTDYYQGLFRNNASGVCIFDDALHISATNRALVSLLQYPEKELCGRHLMDFVAAEDQDHARQMFYDMQHERRFNAIYRKGVRLILCRKDGNRVHVQAALTAIGDGGVLFRRGIGIITDITEEHRCREERDETAKFNEALLRAAPVCIMIIDPCGVITHVNPALEKITGFKERELIGKLGWDSGLLDEETKQGAVLRYRQILADAPKLNITLRLYTKRGGIRILETQSTLARKANGEPLCFILTGVEVTEQKRFEAEVIKVAEQEQMRIGNDLHDGVGQMLTGILSLTEALESQLSGATAKDAQRIRELVREAIQQVRNLSHSLSPAAVKHHGLVSSLRLLAKNISHRQLNCEFRCTWEPKFKNPEAETHLFRIAQEAVSNATKHGKPKHITISLGRDSDERGLMEIHDDGVGLETQKRKRSEGVGIRVMQYRISLLGGAFFISPKQGGGTMVRCHFSCGI